MDASDLARLYEEVQDRLAPLQTPYEQAVCRYLLRHSWAKNGGPEVTVGVRTIAARCGKPARWRGKVGNSVAYQQVRDQLDSLLGKQHIQEKSRSRQGTTYVVLLPDQILGDTTGVATSHLNPYELDHYNAVKRRSLIAERDGWRCFYCLAMLDASNYTLDHIEPKSKGHQADHTPRNLVTACGSCNSSRRDRPIEDFLRDCYRRRLLDQDDLQGQLAYLELVKSDQREIPTALSAPA